MWSSMAILSSPGGASPATAITGNRSIEPAMSTRCGRAASARRAARRRSNARPRRSAAAAPEPDSARRDPLLELLDPPEARVEPAASHELLVTAGVDDPSSVQHDD